VRIWTLAFLAALILPLPLKADTFTYDYTGQAFTLETGAFDSTSSLTGSITFNAPLADNFNGFVSPASFSFTDGISTDTSSDFFGASVFDITTNQSGQIVDWYIALSGWPFSFQSTGGWLGGGDQVNDGRSQGTNWNQGSWSDPGSGNSPVPEPENLVLVGTGLVGLAGLLRRKIQMS
jgi:hypothetical protein